MPRQPSQSKLSDAQELKQMGPIDLGILQILKNRQAQPPIAPPPPVAPPMAQPQPSVANILPETTQQQPQHGNPVMGEFLKRLAVPLLSTIAGLSNSSFLPGAAGLSQGYAGGIQGADELALEQEKIDTAKSKKTLEKKPSKESLLKMAQNEAFRQMGGSAFGGMALQKPEKKSKYDALVKALYDSYVSQFIEGEGEDEIKDENVDTDDGMIEEEWKQYQGGNL